VLANNFTGTRSEVVLLREKVAVITGSASGIGRAGARLFAQEGARVIVADINKQGQQVVDEIKQQGNEAHFVRTDVSLVHDVQNMVKIAVKKYGQVDIFWHNAGIAGPSGIEDTTEETYEKAMAVHLKAGVFGAKFVIPEMQKIGRGCILFTSSISGLKPSPFSLTYSLAKAGLVMLTRCLAVSLAKENIRVNCICPGLVDTPLLLSIATREHMKPEELHKFAVERIPIGRYTTEDEVAQGALFLVSERASAITGIALPIDGGMTAG
jgi:NAD(P)-dependent dehydrogenase (short-subunit alcohol dehydrogenase family)